MQHPASGEVAPSRFFLGGTVVLGGAVVMAVEILGARVIGPFFGVSLFVWTALIAVTLVSLAAGYAIGGWLADRARPARALYACIFGAGLLLLAVPWLRVEVLKACAGLGLRAGSMGAAVTLFGLPLLLLGCVSPLVVRLALQAHERLGRTVGLLASLSTLGSLVGTVGTGYFLIGLMGTDRIFQMAGASLIACAALYFVACERRWIALALMPFPLLVPLPAGPPVRTLSDGTRVSLTASAESMHGSVRVIDYRHGAAQTRELAIDGLVQGGIDLADGRSIYEFSYLLARLPLAYRPGGRSALVIGLGIGSVPRWLEARGIATEVVEIDPLVVDMARRHFALPPATRVEVADARQFLVADNKTSDYLVVDAFTGDSVPTHLLSVEALRAMRARLSAQGVIAFNLHGSLAVTSRMTLAVLKTIASVFPDLRIHKVASPLQDDGIGNLVVIAGTRLPPAPLTWPADMEAIHPFAAQAVAQAIARPVALPDLRDAMILTDDYNPLDLLDLPNKEAVRRGILESTHWDVLLGSRR